MKEKWASPQQQKISAMYRGLIARRYGFKRESRDSEGRTLYMYLYKNGEGASLGRPGGSASHSAFQTSHNSSGRRMGRAFASWNGTVTVCSGGKQDKQLEPGGSGSDKWLEQPEPVGETVQDAAGAHGKVRGMDLVEVKAGARRESQWWSGGREQKRSSPIAQRRRPRLEPMPITVCAHAAIVKEQVILQK